MNLVTVKKSLKKLVFVKIISRNWLRLENISRSWEKL